MQLTGDLKLSRDERDTLDTYLEWTDAATVEKMSIDHKYTSDGLTKMADALEVITKKVSQRVRITSAPKIDSIKVSAANIRIHPASDEHANAIVTAFAKAKEVLEIVQGYSFPALKNEMEEVYQGADSVNSEMLTLEQRPEIIAKFRQVSSIMKLMLDPD